MEFYPIFPLTIHKICKSNRSPPITHFFKLVSKILVASKSPVWCQARSRFSRWGGSESWTRVGFGGFESWERTSETGFDRNTPPRLGYTLSPPRLADKLLNIWIDRQQNPPPYVFDFLVIVNVEKGGLCLNIWKKGGSRKSVRNFFCRKWKHQRRPYSGPTCTRVKFKKHIGC